MTWKEVAIGVGGLVGAAQLARLKVPGRYRSLYEQFGKQYGVDPNLLHAIALKESRENAQAVSPPNRNGSRDYGVMQINEANLSRYGLSTASALVAGPNIDAAARLIRDIQRSGIKSYLDTFSIYNAGASAHDADPTMPGFQARAKLSDAGTTYSNEAYVREAFMWYILVLFGSYAPLQTHNWS